MSLTNATKTKVDDPYLQAVLEDGGKPAACNGNLGTGDFSRVSNNSTGSIDYSKTQGSSRNFSSQCDYSEDFISENSGTAGNGSCLELFEAKVVKKEEKKKKNVCKVSQLKGFKEISPEKLQNWNAALTSQINIITQRRDAMAHRIMSARLHKIKELKNELADIHRKLEATVLENQLLKRLQFRHLKAIGKYENSQNNLPQLMAKHQSEVKNLRQLLRKSQEKERNVSRKLRETDNELLKTKDSLITLQKLSEDKNLAEREELTQKLSSLTTKMEANDKRIQSLERQLRLSSNAFSRQLAAENRKTITAKATTKNLQMEIKRLQQKLKEKDRELDIKNIYTNRFLKNLYDKDDQTKVYLANKSTQAEKKTHLFPHIVTVHQVKQNTEDISLTAKDEKTIIDDVEKEKPVFINSEVIYDISKLPTQEDPEKIYKEGQICIWKMEAVGTTQKIPDIQDLLLKEDLRRELQSPPESNGKPREKREDVEKKLILLKEQETLAKIEHVVAPLLESNPQNAGKERFKSSAPPQDPEELQNKYVIQNSRIPLRQRKHYSFTEAIENLHQGLPTSGPCNAGNTRNSQALSKQQGSALDLKLENSPGGYEPSFGKSSKSKAKDFCAEKSGNAINTTLKDRKNNLMEELFGSGCVLKANPSHADYKPSNKGKESLRADLTPDPPNGQSTAINAFGDSKVFVCEQSLMANYLTQCIIKRC
ncbi:lebercilin-like protein isoform X2 [Monodelphis domestica]|uniref:lebercilin-like protein isoform X2 n=1 Tax=Monodelphis domestica TaxID=13616 RepID=UPI0004432356|nr:lebercilin-like protein isoform X2 [Monodelphis domestica]